MLTRRGFTAVAGCAICGITEFIATEAFAQGAVPPAVPGVTRKILSQIDGPVPGYTTIVMEVTVAKGTTVARHTHPGIESSYVLEGTVSVPVEGQPTRSIKAGEAIQIPPETPHAGGPPIQTDYRALVNYIVEKGKPLISPA
jgi:quercetin dioxygenase-like cupin family protein